MSNRPHVEINHEHEQDAQREPVLHYLAEFVENQEIQYIEEEHIGNEDEDSEREIDKDDEEEENNLCESVTVSTSRQTKTKTKIPIGWIQNPLSVIKKREKQKFLKTNNGDVGFNIMNKHITDYCMTEQESIESQMTIHKVFSNRDRMIIPHPRRWIECMGCTQMIRTDRVAIQACHNGIVCYYHLGCVNLKKRLSC